MEENKNHESHEGKKSHVSCCQGSLNHKIIKIALVVVAAIILLSIGAAYGERRAERNNFYRQNGFGPGMMQGNWQNNNGTSGRQFRTCDNQNFINQGNQAPGANTGATGPSAINPANPNGTTTSATPQQ